MRVELAKFGKRLQGKPAGRKHFAEICRTLAHTVVGEAVLLDFDGVESVNASWINMAIAPLTRWCAEAQNDLFPLLVNFPAKDLDELELVAEKNQQCYVVAADAVEPPKVIHLVGPLDPSLQVTLLRLLEQGEATGAELARKVADSEILPTAWNNRLKDLHDMRLLRRRKDGRQQVYRALAEEVVLHGR